MLNFLKNLLPVYIIYLINGLIIIIKYKSILISNKSFLKNVKIGKKVMIYGGVKLDNCEIGDFTYIAGSDAGGIVSRFKNVQIGKYCSIAHNVEVISETHYTNHITTYPLYSTINSPFYNPYNSSDQLITSVVIGNDVWIGAHVKILGNLSIGDGVIIGAGAVVTKNIEPYSIVAGVPAKLIKKRFSEDIINKLLEIKWWERDITFLKDYTEKLNKEYTTDFIKDFKNNLFTE